MVPPSSGSCALAFCSLAWPLRSWVEIYLEVVFGGCLWALSNFAVLPLVKLLGIGLGFSLYHFQNMIVGRLGLQPCLACGGPCLQQALNLVLATLSVEKVFSDSQLFSQHSMAVLSSAISAAA
eukprot:s242_g17.t2